MRKFEKGFEEFVHGMRSVLSSMKDMTAALAQQISTLRSELDISRNVCYAFMHILYTFACAKSHVNYASNDVIIHLTIFATCKKIVIGEITLNTITSFHL